MKNLCMFITCFFAAIFVVSFIYVKIVSGESTITYNRDEVKRILKIVNDSPVYAEIIKDTNTYKDKSEFSAVDGRLKKGDIIEIIEERDKKWYKTKKGWIKSDCIKIPDDKKTNLSKLSDEDICCYVNVMGLSSKTKYLVWTNIDRQMVYVLSGKKGNWKVIKKIVCATGKNESPTTRGLFEISERGKWFYSQRLNSGAMYYVRFNGSYLFHSIAMDKDKNVIDGVLGQRRSSGCIRMSLDDSKWFFENIPEKSRVFIN